MDEYLVIFPQEKKGDRHHIPIAQSNPLYIFTVVCVCMCTKVFLCISVCEGIVWSADWVSCLYSNRQRGSFSIWCRLVEMVLVRDRHVILLACCCLSSIPFSSCSFSLFSSLSFIQCLCVMQSPCFSVPSQGSSEAHCFLVGFACACRHCMCFSLRMCNMHNIYVR